MRVFLVKAMQMQLKQYKILYGILLSLSVCACVKVTQLCLTLCNPMDCSLPGASVCGILQARILESVAIPFSRGSSQPRDRSQVSRTAGGFFTIWATREAQCRAVVRIKWDNLHSTFFKCWYYHHCSEEQMDCGRERVSESSAVLSCSVVSDSLWPHGL